MCASALIGGDYIVTDERMAQRRRHVLIEEYLHADG
jgi:hypothetical protein